MSTQNQQYQTSANKIHWLDPETIEDSPYQPSTRVMTPEEQREFDASIEELGVMQEILVRPVTGKKHKSIEYQCVFGHQRRDACKRLGRRVPARIEKLTDTEAAAKTLAENVVRKQLTDLQEAESIAEIQRKAAERGEGDTTRAIARAMGKSSTYVSNALKLLEVKPDVKAVAARHSLVKSACLEINKISDKDERAPLLALVEQGTGYREIKQKVDDVLAKQKQQKESTRAPDPQTQSRQTAFADHGGGSMSRGRQVVSTSRSDANKAVKEITNRIESEIVLLNQWIEYAAPTEVQKALKSIQVRLNGLNQ